MTQYLEALQVGNSCLVESVPVGKIQYLGYGTFKIKKLESIGTKTEIGFVAGGTGIAPCLSLIYASLHKNDKVKLSLIFANLTEEDIVLKKEIDGLA
jgi:NAD(P)H-flavin reductase